MNLSQFEIMERCEKMVNNNGETKVHSKHAIQIYLACSHFFGDIDEDMFKTLIAYFDEKFKGEPKPKKAKKEKYIHPKIEVDMIEVRRLLELGVPKKHIAKRMGVGLHIIYARIKEN